MINFCNRCRYNRRNSEIPNFCQVLCPSKRQMDCSAQTIALLACRLLNLLASRIPPCLHIGCRLARFSVAVPLTSWLQPCSHLADGCRPDSISDDALLASRLQPCSLPRQASAAVLARRRRRRRARCDSPGGKCGHPRWPAQASPASSSPPVPGGQMRPSLLADVAGVELATSDE